MTFPTEDLLDKFGNRNDSTVVLCHSVAPQFTKMSA